MGAAVAGCLLQARGCSAAVFGLPAVQAVINYKWHTWAKKFLLYELACYLAWLAGYTAFTLLFQQEVCAPCCATACAPELGYEFKRYATDEFMPTGS
jgi:hypothetical protein